MPKVDLILYCICCGHQFKIQVSNIARTEYEIGNRSVNIAFSDETETIQNQIDLSLCTSCYERYPTFKLLLNSVLKKYPKSEVIIPRETKIKA